MCAHATGPLALLYRRTRWANLPTNTRVEDGKEFNRHTHSYVEMENTTTKNNDLKSIAYAQLLDCTINSNDRDQDLRSINIQTRAFAFK